MAAYTDQELAILAAAVASLPTAAHNLISTKSATETTDAITTLIAKSRSDSAADVVKTLVTISVSNWPALKTYAAAMPSGTILADMEAAKAAYDANDAATFGPRLVNVFLAAVKHFSM